MAWTYILECRDGSYYMGSTVDLAARLHQHQVGEGAAYTRPRRRRPVRLLWSGEIATAPEAFAFEKQVQGWSRARREALARGDFAAMPELATRPTARRSTPDGD